MNRKQNNHKDGFISWMICQSQIHQWNSVTVVWCNIWRGFFAIWKRRLIKATQVVSVTNIDRILDECYHCFLGFFISICISLVFNKNRNDALCFTELCEACWGNSVTPPMQVTQTISTALGSSRWLAKLSFYPLQQGKIFYLQLCSQ